MELLRTLTCVRSPSSAIALIRSIAQNLDYPTERDPVFYVLQSAIYEFFDTPEYRGQVIGVFFLLEASLRFELRYQSFADSRLTTWL